MSPIHTGSHCSCRRCRLLVQKSTKNRTLSTKELVLELEDNMLPKATFGLENWMQYNERGAVDDAGAERV